MAVITLLVELVSGHPDLLRVHDDDEVSGVDMRRVFRLSLATERVGDAGREPAKRLPVGIHDVPVAGDLARFRVVGLHHGKGGLGRPPAANASSPALNSAPPPWAGWRTYGAPVTRSASRPTARRRRPWASSSRNGREASTSSIVGALFEL